MNQRTNSLLENSDPVLYLEKWDATSNARELKNLNQSIISLWRIWSLYSKSAHFIYGKGFISWTFSLDPPPCPYFHYLLLVCWDPGLQKIEVWLEIARGTAGPVVVLAKLSALWPSIKQAFFFTFLWSHVWKWGTFLALLTLGWDLVQLFRVPDTEINPPNVRPGVPGYNVQWVVRIPGYPGTVSPTRLNHMSALTSSCPWMILYVCTKSCWVRHSSRERSPSSCRRSS